MKDKIEALRESLYIAIEKSDKELILKISEELDKLIALYYNNDEEENNK